MGDPAGEDAAAGQAFVQVGREVGPEAGKEEDARKK